MYLNRRKKFFFIFMVLSLCFSICFHPILAWAEPAPVGDDYFSTGDPDVCRVGEIVDMRNADMKVYQLSNGQIQYVLYSGNVHYQDASGKFQDIETELVSSSLSTERGQYTLKSKANIFTLRFGNALSDSKAPGEQQTLSYPVSVECGDKSLSFAFRGGSASPARQGENPLAGTSLEEFFSATNGVAYPEVYPNVDMVYLSLACGLKEYIVLKTPTRQTEYVFDLALEGVSPAEDEEGGYIFVDASGKTVFELGGLYAVDAKGIETSDVSCELVEEEGRYALHLEVDEAYLSDPERAWPVMIDPTVMVTGSSVTFDSFVSRGNPGTNYNSGSEMPYLRTGKTSYNNLELCQTYIKFNMPSGLDSSRITSAYMRLKKYTGLNRNLTTRRIIDYWSSNTITWNNRPGYSSENTTANPDSSSWYQFNVSGIVPAWIGGLHNNGVPPNP